MKRNTEAAVLRAAEAALAHLVMTSKMLDSKMISEGTLYETVGQTLAVNGCEWVNHEHPVNLVGSSRPEKKSRGDGKRVDFGVKSNDRVTLIEVKIGSRTKLMPSVDVSRDMEKLVSSSPSSPKTIFADKVYLIVFNIRTYDSHGDRCGYITWKGRPDESSVHCIGRYLYKSKNYVRTAAVFRISR